MIGETGAFGSNGGTIKKSFMMEKNVMWLGIRKEETN